MTNANKCYLRFTVGEHGRYTVAPADIATFEKARGVGERLEGQLTPMPTEVTLTSLAISMARIAESLETLEHIGFINHQREARKARPFWKRLTEKKECAN